MYFKRACSVILADKSRSITSEDNKFIVNFLLIYKY